MVVVVVVVVVVEEEEEVVVVVMVVAVVVVVPKALLPKGKRPGCLPTGKGKRAGLCVLCARRA